MQNRHTVFTQSPATEEGFYMIKKGDSRFSSTAQYIGNDQWFSFLTHKGVINWKELIEQGYSRTVLKYDEL